MINWIDDYNTNWMESASNIKENKLIFSFFLKKKNKK